MKKLQKMLTFFITGTILFSMSNSAFAVTDEHSHDDDYGYIPDYFEEHNIDTSNHPIFNFSNGLRTISEFERTMFITYSDGKFYSYASDNRDKPCACHGNCAPSSSSSKCVRRTTSLADPVHTCISYDGAIQCAGFAKQAHYLITDRTYNNGTKTTINVSTTAASAKEKLFNSGVGTIVNVLTAPNAQGEQYEHYMVILATYNDKISIYHANYGEPCKVKVQTVTWADFAAAFPYMYFKLI